ncbi:MAG: beta-glucosidase [Paludibacteraceae bacterium]|nr:beta-glucosidase [Paludibacteraceae bacterium]
MTTNLIKYFLPVLLFVACERQPNINSSKGGETSQTDSAFLDMLQKAHFDYMWTGAELNSGMAYERIHEDGDYGYDDPTIITTGGSGFGIAGIIVAIDRGFITRQEGVERLNKIVRFLSNANRFHGVWPHWLYPSGRVCPFGQKDNGGDLVESCFLMQGLLIARQYMNPEVATEKAVIDGINALWQEMEFDWYTRGGQKVLYWHWSPDYEWQMNFPLQGYNECLITYILALASPTHPIDVECYEQGWSRNGNIRSSAAPYGYPLGVSHNGAEATGGPLFWAHYSWIGLDPHQLVDKYADYWQVVQNHALSNYAYCVENPKNYTNYSDSCWGLTASYSVNGYSAHAPNNDLGVITPTAALSSFPYTPQESMAAARYFYNRKPLLWGEYGFYDAFSKDARWYPHRYLAIDQLTIAPMIENYRSGLLWRLFMSCPEIQAVMKKIAGK